MRPKRTREGGTVEMTPLVDVVFLLLIFFMVSSVFKKEELALLLTLPSSESGASAQQKKIVTIELSEKEVAYNGKKVDFPRLEEHLQKVQNTEVPIDLRIDKDVRYERIIGLVDMLKKYNLTNLSLISGP